MKKTKVSTKKDFKFILISVAIIALFFVASIFLDNDRNLDYKDLPDDFDPSIGKLIISEVMANNGGAFVNSNNDCTDYVELYNGSNNEINLSNYGLSDKAGTVKWVFTNTIIKPNEYIVVGLSGKSENGLNAGFKLTANGDETVILTNPSGKVADAVKVEAIGKNEVMVRDENGSWYVSYDATPGFENSKAGREAYLNSLYNLEDKSLLINEVMPKNNGNFLNEYGDMTGFIEVKNISDNSIKLNEYYLSNTIGAPFKFKLPKVTLKSGDVYVLYVGDGIYGSDNYLGFNLDSGSGEVILSHNGRIIQNLKYTELDSGKAYVLDDNGTYYETGVVSPGFSNTVDGINKFQTKFMDVPKGLIISEVMNENHSYLPQNGAEYYDWIELYNNGKDAINLGDYYLSNDKNNLSLYKLPSVALNPSSYFIIMCSGDTNLSNSSYNHANFKIGDSDGIYLSKDNKLVDSLFISDVPNGYSYGRGEENGFFYMKPTPKEKNNSGHRFVNASPEFSNMGGVFNDVNFITISLSGSGTIRYTTDGSIPTSYSKEYTGPFNISKTSVVKAKSFSDGALSSKIGYNSYIINEGHTFDVISITLNPEDFSYINSHSGSSAEHQAYVEFYEDGNYFKTPCSISLFGGNARWQPQKSYTLRFDSEWGAGNLHYQIFKNRDNSVYDAIVLRSGSTEQGKSIVKDVVSTTLMDDYTDVDTQSYHSVVCYINGKYWGIYNLREKVNKQFLKEHYNVPCDDVDILRIDGDDTIGNRKRYNSIKSFIKNNDLSIKENFDKLSEMIDLQNVIDYWIGEAWTFNNDILNCRFFMSSDIDNGKLKYIFYDLDYGWIKSRVSGYNAYVNGTYNGYLVHYPGIGYLRDFDNEIIRNLIPNKYFKEMWLDRLSYNLKNTWSMENVLDRIDFFFNLYSPEIKRSQSRWNRTLDQWIAGLEEMRYFATYRGYYLMKETKEYYHLTNEEMVNLFGEGWNVKPTYSSKYKVSDIA